MNIENQVCSLELAKKIKSLGVKTESYYSYFPSQTIIGEKIQGESMMLYAMQSESPDAVRAYTSSELMEMLPHRILSSQHESPFNDFVLYINKRIWVVSGENDKLIVEHYYYMNYISTTTGEEMNWDFNAFLEKPIHDTNFSNALAKMLIVVLENDKIIGVHGETICEN